MTDLDRLIRGARTDIADADRCITLGISPAARQLHRRLREVTNELESLRDKETGVDLSARGGMIPVDVPAHGPIGLIEVRKRRAYLAAGGVAETTLKPYALIRLYDVILDQAEALAEIRANGVTVIDTRDTGREEHALALLAIALDELPVGAVIRDAGGRIFEKRLTTGDFHWGGVLTMAFSDEREMSQPITVLYSPAPPTEGAPS